MFKRLLIAAALMLVVSPAAGCAQAASAVGQAIPAVATNYTKSSVLDEKALIAAETAYNVPAQAYVVANRRGLLSPELKAAVKPKLQMAKSALDIARQAYAAGDADTLADQVRAVQRLADAAKALLPPS